MHAHDRSLASRALAFAVVVALIALVIVVTTDEPGSTASMRVARMSALAPAFALVGGGVALGDARGRGELRALEALGAPPWLVASGVVVVGWIIGALAVALVVSPLADVSALFPAVESPAAWEPAGGGFVDRVAGLRVDAAGDLHLAEAAPIELAAAAPGAVDALLWLGPLAFGTPVWLVSPGGVGLRAGTLGATVVASLLLLHAVAVGAAAHWLPLASVPLLLPMLSRALVDARSRRGAA